MNVTSSPGRPNLLPEKLREGYESFLGARFSAERERYRKLAHRGQNPEIMIISCCDSRVAPEVIFDAGPGELFVLRNVAALAPPYRPNDDYHGTSAALEFAIIGLQVSHVVVMGHALCGGIKAYAQQAADPSQRPLSSGDFIGSWIKLIAPAAEALGAAPDRFDLGYVERLSLQSIRQTLANLRTFPWIVDLEARGALMLHGAYFDVADGALWALNENEGRFETVAPEAHRAAFQTPRF